jgi:sulfate adenylyltransferase subunit 2
MTHVSPADERVAGSADQQAPDASPRLRELESEAIAVIRTTLAEFARPALLFSGGKDSTVVLELARRAVAPAPLTLPLLHVDTGHNFTEVLGFREHTAQRLGLPLLVASVENAVSRGALAADVLHSTSRNRFQSPVLLEAVRQHGFDALLGGARRDEEKARSKERVFSLRDPFGQWDPRGQRPEPWGLPNTRLPAGHSMRVFPLSNWTELDVWRYIDARQIALPSLYYAHQRAVFRRNGMLLADLPEVRRPPNTLPVTMSVRYRTVGDSTCTGAVPSRAATTTEVITEITDSRITERGATRADDRISEAAMEDRKREGYF